MQDKYSFFKQKMKENQHPDKENEYTPFVSPMDLFENPRSVNRSFEYNSQFNFPESSSYEPTIENGGMPVNALQSIENIGSTEQLNFRTLKYPTPKKPSIEEEKSIKSFLNF